MRLRSSLAGVLVALAALIVAFAPLPEIPAAASARTVRVQASQFA